MSRAFGSKFCVISEQTFFLRGTYGRFEHRVTIGFGLREFIYFIDTWTGKTYIEEITGGHGPILIQDDNLWHDLATFIEEHGYSVMGFKDK